MQLLWTVVTYSLKKIELNMVLIVLMETSGVPEIYSRFDEYSAV